MAAGSIIVDLLARTGSFETDIKRAESRLRSLSKESRATASAFKGSFAGNLLSDFTQQVTSALVRLPGILIDGAAAFKDLEETTGASAEGLASLQVASATAGLSIDEVAGASLRLTKNLTGVDDESKAAGAALASLGLPIEEFKKLDPVGQIDALAKAFSEFADGPKRAEVAMALFGKTGAEQLKLFKALEEQGGRTTILTQQQIGLADAYADAQAKTTAELKLYAQAAAAIASGPLLDLAKALKTLLAEMIGVDKTTGQLAANNGIRAFAESAAIAVANVTDFLINLRKVALTVGDAFGAVGADIRAAFKVAGAVASFGPAQGIEETTNKIKAALDDREAQVRGANERLNSLLNSNPRALRDNLSKSFAERARLEQPDDARENARFSERAADLLSKPALKFSGAVKPPKKAKADTDDPTKQLLDNRLKDIQAAMDRERDLLASRNKFLDIYNAQGLLSIKSYYDSQHSIIDAATSAQAALIDDQIAELRKFQEAPKRKETDKADAQGKINELVAKRVELISNAGEKGIELAIKQTEEERRLEQQIEAVNAQVLELHGSLGAAAEIRFDQQNLDLVRRLMAEGNQGALQLVETLRKATIAQAEFTEAVAGADKVSAALRGAEDRVAISRQLGATTELGALQQLGQARQAAVVQLESIVRAQESVAAASQNPALVRQADEARIALERLRAEADPLREKFDSIFEGGFGDAFADFLDGTKSAKEAFRSFADDVVRQINRIVAQELAQSLFGKSGAAGGLGGFVSQIFGGTTGASGGGSMLGATGDFARMDRNAQSSSGGGWLSAVAQIAAMFLHNGGIVSGGDARHVSANVFQGASRYHSGGAVTSGKSVPGLAPSEVPAILLRNEEVLTANDPRHQNNIPRRLLNRINQSSSIQEVVDVAVKAQVVAANEEVHGKARGGAPLTGLAGVADGGWAPTVAVPESLIGAPSAKFAVPASGGWRAAVSLPAPTPIETAKRPDTHAEIAARPVSALGAAARSVNDKNKGAAAAAVSGSFGPAATGYQGMPVTELVMSPVRADSILPRLEAVDLAVIASAAHGQAISEQAHVRASRAEPISANDDAAVLRVLGVRASSELVTANHQLKLPVWPMARNVGPASVAPSAAARVAELAALLRIDHMVPYGGARAAGGDVRPNMSYLVGEAGPERFVPRTAGVILPTQQPVTKGSGSNRTMTVTNHFAINGPTDTRTQQQIAAAVARGLASANIRGN